MKSKIQSHIKKSLANEHIKKSLANENDCYVLITCGEPTPDGQLQVELAYEGDPILASYLLEGAQNVIDNHLNLES